MGTGGTLPKTIDLSERANEKTLLQKNISLRSSVTSDRIALRKKVVIYLEIPTLIMSVKTLIPKKESQGCVCKRGHSPQRLSPL